MISEYLFRGIDNIFPQRLIQHKNSSTTKPLTRDLIKANLHTVIKDGSQNNQNVSPLKKSRLRSILQKNKSSQLKSVIRRDNSRSASPYQKINAKVDSPCYDKYDKEKADKILYYREQRKTIEKSRVLEKSRIGASNSRIFRVSSQLKLDEETRQHTISHGHEQLQNKAKLQLKNIIRY